MAMSSSAIRLASSTGIAKPRPIEPLSADAEPNAAFAEFIPTSCPFAFTNAPPELPGLSGASVWMASIAVVWSAEPERGRQRPVQSADDARCDCAVQTQRGTHRHDLLADAKVG